MTNSIELEVEMKRHGDIGKTLSEYLDISQQTFISKKNGKSEFTQSEIALIQKRYSLSAERVQEIFFA